MFSVILLRFSGWTLLVQPSRRLQLETGLFKLIAISVRLVEVEASILFSLSSEKKLFLYWNVHKKYLWKKFYLWMLLIWIVYLQIEMPRKHQSLALLNASQYGVFLDDAVRYRVVMRLRKFQFPKTMFIIWKSYLGLICRYLICNSLSLRIIICLENIAKACLSWFLLLFNLFWNQWLFIYNQTRHLNLFISLVF